MATTTRRPSGPMLSVSHRSASPTRVKLAGAARSPGQSVSISSPAGGRRRTCMCSPTNHPGSFRCSLHKEPRSPNRKPVSPPSPPVAAAAAAQSRLGAKRAAMGSSLVRIGAVEGGEWARRALAAAVRPSPAAQQRRRAGGFRARPSRLSAVSMAGDRVGDNEL